MAGTGSRVGSGCKAETDAADVVDAAVDDAAVVAAVAVDDAAAAAVGVGWADSVPKVWTVPLLLAVLAEV